MNLSSVQNGITGTTESNFLGKNYGELYKKQLIGMNKSNLWDLIIL